MEIKKILLGVALTATLVVSGVFAYTPTQAVQEKIDEVVERIETVIEKQGESVRALFVKRLQGLKSDFEDNVRVGYIIDYIIGEITVPTNDSNDYGRYFGSYTIDDTTYGSEVRVTVNNSTRSIVSNAIPNHETGSFPNVGNPNTITEQQKSWEYPTSASYQGDEVWAREVGVAINGIKFEPETGERVECDSGETYRIEAIQEEVNLGLDHQHAHVQPTGEYHYHGVSQDLVAFGSQVASDEDLVHVGFAADGFHIYYSKSGLYTPSYTVSSMPRIGTSCDYRGRSVDINGTSPDGTYKSDRVYDASIGDLDQCNGIEIEGEYVYIVTDEYPFVSRCLNGEYQETKGPGGPGRIPPR